MRGLRTWAVSCFRGLAAIKQASNYKKRRDLALLKITQKLSTMMFDLITYALNSILSVPIT